MQKLIWLWSDFSLIYGEFFPPNFWQLSKSDSSIVSYGGEKNSQKINEKSDQRQIKYAHILEGALMIKWLRYANKMSRVPHFCLQLS